MKVGMLWLDIEPEVEPGISAELEDAIDALADVRCLGDQVGREVGPALPHAHQAKGLTIRRLLAHARCVAAPSAKGASR